MNYQMLQKKFECNINDAGEALKSDRRIGYEAYLNAGQAYSGGTLARDVQFFYSK